MVFAEAGDRVSVTTSRGSVKARAWARDSRVGGLVRLGERAAIFTGDRGAPTTSSTWSWGRSFRESLVIAPRRGEVHAEERGSSPGLRRTRTTCRSRDAAGACSPSWASSFGDDEDGRIARAWGRGEAMNGRVTASARGRRRRDRRLRRSRSGTTSPLGEGVRRASRSDEARRSAGDGGPARARGLYAAMPVRSSLAIGCAPGPLSRSPCGRMYRLPGREPVRWSGLFAQGYGQVLTRSGPGVGSAQRSCNDGCR